MRPRCLSPQTDKRLRSLAGSAAGSGLPELGGLRSLAGSAACGALGEPMPAGIAPQRMASPPVSRRSSTVNQSDTSMDEHSSAPTSKPRPSSEPCPPPRARGSHTPRHESRKERSTKKSSKGTALKNWQRVMLAVLFLCGPIGTAVSFYLLPKESDSADTPGLIRGGATGATGAAGGTRVRMVHLSLAGTDRRARFVLDENTPWDAFVSGCRERLKVERILRVTDSSGEAILAVEDLVHEDHIVIHATMGGGQAAPSPSPSPSPHPHPHPHPHPSRYPNPNPNPNPTLALALALALALTLIPNPNPDPNPNPNLNLGCARPRPRRRAPPRERTLTARALVGRSGARRGGGCDGGQEPGAAVRRRRARLAG